MYIDVIYTVLYILIWGYAVFTDPPLPSLRPWKKLKKEIRKKIGNFDTYDATDI